MQSERNVSTKPRGKDVEFLATETYSPQRIAGDQRRGRISRATRHPTGQRDRLLDLKFHIERNVGIFGKRVRGSPHQVLFGVREVLRTLAFHAQRDARTRDAIGSRDLVVDVHSVKNTDDLVVSVGSQRTDG